VTYIERRSNPRLARRWTTTSGGTTQTDFWAISWEHHRSRVLDASPYEGADTIHDMNTPVPEVWHGRYDVVIDSGSLEHIFNFSVAIANLANMLRVGGTIFVTTPANNLMGHGFYQFSPELMFWVFSESNGFAVHKILLVEAGYPSVELMRNHTVYEVTDPKHVRE
jgi:hypothetical protein